MSEDIRSPDNQEEKRETDSTAKRRLIKDFYLSFKFSQGKPSLQMRLFSGLKDYYETQLSPEELQEVKDFLPSLTDETRGLHPPRLHSALDPESGSQEEQIKGDMVKFSRAMSNIVLTGTDPEFLDGRIRTFDESINEIFDWMVGRDIAYQDKPRTITPDDPNKSYFRDYVLIETPTESEGLDYVFHRLKEALPQQMKDETFTAQLTELGQAWEVNHPGEHFYPQEPDSVGTSTG